MERQLILRLLIIENQDRNFQKPLGLWFWPRVAWSGIWNSLSLHGRPLCSVSGFHFHTVSLAALSSRLLSHSNQRQTFLSTVHIDLHLIFIKYWHDFAFNFKCPVNPHCPIANRTKTSRFQFHPTGWSSCSSQRAPPRELLLSPSHWLWCLLFSSMLVTLAVWWKPGSIPSLFISLLLNKVFQNESRLGPPPFLQSL